MNGYSSVQLIEYLVKNDLVKIIDNVHYFTDKLLASAGDLGSPKATLKQFCKDIEMPFQVLSPNGGKYTVRYVTLPAGKKLLRILKKVDMALLVEVTKKYYKETQFPHTIGNYLEKDLWEGAIESKDISLGASLNLFEE